MYTISMILVIVPVAQLTLRLGANPKGSGSSPPFAIG
jgi:hypothetical protein